ncbi:ATP-binding protein [Paenibacillus hodogayensis]|uniref:histidine kinase n=1 Tax=Paenibacillus hodogayensis TaxID=279208 RepID=A0ABV5VVU2_9BACL
MMTKRNLLAVCLLFIASLTAIRIVWVYAHKIPDHPAATRGTLDLRGWAFQTQKPITLDGEWEFYPGIFLNGSTMPPSPDFSDRKVFLAVPGNWNTAIPSPPYGFGTYRLRIAIDPAPGQGFGIRMQNLPASSRLYVNGKLRVASGQPAADKADYTARNVPYSTLFSADGSEIEIVLEMANFDDVHGGIVSSIKFGGAEPVYREEQLSNLMQLIVVMVLLLHAIYAALLYGVGARLNSLLVFALLGLSSVLLTLVDDDKLLLVWLPISHVWSVRLLFAMIVTVPMLMITFFRMLLPKYVGKRLYRSLISLLAAALLFALTVPLGLLESFSPALVLLVWTPFLLSPWITLRASLHGEEDALYLALGTIAVANSAVWGIVKSFWLPYIGYYPFDLLICFLAFAAFWFKRYFRTARQTELFAGKLQEANKRKDDFLANTSHELRNPLHGMMNIAQSIQERYKIILGKKGADDLELLVSIGRRMSFMLNDLLDLNRLQDSGIRLHVGGVHLQAVASGVLDMLRFMTEGKPIKLVSRIPESFPPVLADENRLVQIMFNLLHNAVKFTNEGSITIDAAVQRNIAVIRVADTGIGMDEETQRRVFQPYEQAEAGLAASGGGGLGLGLGICSQLVELHGGTLTVASVPGQGSVFTFTLPLAERVEAIQAQASGRTGAAEAEDTGTGALAAAESVDAAAQVAADGGEVADNAWTDTDKSRILAVDDDPINLSILSDMLSTGSYRVVTAKSGSEALSLLDTGEWDLIVADIMMPQMSGYALTKRIRERFSLAELPVLLLTARSRPEDVEAGFLAGANDYVTKPVDAHELRARVRALTEMRRSVREQLRIEAACLQAQIQPHFLFNTLNSIAALSEIDTTRMRALLGKFGHYLRASFDFRNSERLVPLSHELGLVRSYLFIEKERFEERLEVEWEIDEHLPLSLPPLSIQPLVENAVKHGILARPRGGKLSIRIRDHDSYAEIAVIDDGIGMDGETQKSLLDPKSDNRSGIGLRNTDRRLKQLYGKGLDISSVPGKGTRVTFHILK